MLLSASRRCMSNGSISTLLKAATGSAPLSFPAFPLTAAHLPPAPSNPSEFHEHLVSSISSATDRVTIGSLYVGPGSLASSAPREDELLSALRAACSRDVPVNVLLDRNRGLRPQQHTSSAGAVHSALSSPQPSSSSLSLFSVPPPPVVPPFLTLPSPLNEIGGVFHLKAYIADDSLLLTGANLSEEYFTDRIDRYFLFSDGAGGLVDFYDDLIKSLASCPASSPYPPTLPPARRSAATSDALAASLSSLIARHPPPSGDDATVAYAVPTFQCP
ncbi:hypothetical protein TeGR_g5939 [Tetraparma gracilis]|uniref:CDP-diacylglycerol--glycerol-3-phosphate 3-phosphatidyltransferase n=1 Tax=Tetraparma gracilis TaxID=2962635 RepID=A0ABQ6MW72_9STRA|nr:hypothetical protein TeGR_g5939 [Tetraparma gracilis]